MHIEDMIDGPIKMVTFDLYDTLIEADPPGWIRFQNALELSGFDIDLADVMRAYTAGQQFFTVENGQYPIRDRSPAEITQFQINLTNVSLKALNLPVDDETVEKVKSNFQDDTRAGKILGYRPYDEVPDVLERLRQDNIVTAIISNADSDVTQLCLQMGFAKQMDLIVTSALVGWEKPDARTFHAALEPMNLSASSALHVGDQPDSDVLGARAVGMGAALLDRYDQYPSEPENAMRVTSLSQLAELVLEYNESIS